MSVAITSGWKAPRARLSDLVLGVAAAAVCVAAAQHVWLVAVDQVVVRRGSMVELAQSQFARKNQVSTIIVRTRPATDDVKLTLNKAFLNTYTVTGIRPAPSSKTYSDGELNYVFDVPKGTSLTAAVDVVPATTGAKSSLMTVAIGSTSVSALNINQVVLP